MSKKNAVTETKTKTYHVDYPVAQCRHDDDLVESLINKLKSVAAATKNKKVTHVAIKPQFWCDDIQCGMMPNSCKTSSWDFYLSGVSVVAMAITPHANDYPENPIEYIRDIGEVTSSLLSRHIVPDDEVTEENLGGFSTNTDTNPNNKNSQIFRAFQKLVLHRDVLEFHDDAEVALRDALMANILFDGFDEGHLHYYLYNLSVVYRVSDGTLFFRRHFS